MNLDRVIAVRNDKIIYRNSDRCIKVFSTGHTKADVLNEALNQSRAEETGLNVPEIFEVTKIEGKWAIISEYIKGKTLSRLIKENPEKKAEYMELFVDLQMEVHKQTCPLLHKLKDKMIRKIAETRFDATTRYDLHTRLDSMPRHKKLCHGDFSLSNVILAENGTPYILDWAHAAQGNASADVARTYLLFWMGGDISGAERYLELFCQKSGTEKEYVRKWLPLVAAAQSVHCREIEREFLVSWVNDVKGNAN